MDRLWFSKWLIHDWLMSNPWTSVNGMRGRVDRWAHSEVFGGLTKLVLYVAAAIV